MKSRTRYPLLDYLRALAIVLMVIYHFIYDLASLKFIPYEFYKSIGIIIIGRSSLLLFLFCVGLSLCLSHYPRIRWPAFNKRLIKIILGACAISFGSYLVDPGNWVYFGILHCIAVSSILGLVFFRVPAWINITLGSALIYAYYGQGIAILPKLYQPTLDYISIVPWFGSVLFGIAAYQLTLHERLHNIIKLPKIKAIQWLSEKSFWIYLLHQPIIFSSLSAYKYLAGHL